MHGLEISQIPHGFADFVREVVEFLDLGLFEQQAIVLLGMFTPVRFRLAGQHALFVAVAEHVFDDRFDVALLVATAGIIVALERFGMNDLKEER